MVSTARPELLTIDPRAGIRRCAGQRTVVRRMLPRRLALGGAARRLVDVAGSNPPPPASLSTAQIDSATPPANDGAPRPIAAANDSDGISVEELRALQAAGAPLLIVDVRAETSFNSSPFQAQGALRIPADQIVRRIAELNVPRQTWIITFCA